MIPKECKRLAEVDFPIAEVSKHATRETSIRHGNPSTLHRWWARRPLASSRAILMALLLPDPCDPLCPENFKNEARYILRNMNGRPQGWDKAIKSDAGLRRIILEFVADFANWNNSTDTDYLTTARTLTQCAHETLGGIPETRPLVADPFAGGGSIPLESLRVGADAFASDLNPVPVLLNKVILEYIPRYGQRLADEVRKWGRWIRDEAEKELAEFYPKDEDGSTPIAYLWARTIISEDPGQRNPPIEVPLMRSL